MKKPNNLKSGICNLKLYLCLSVFICGLIFLSPEDFALKFTRGFLLEVSAENLESEIEKAVFTRQEFFGASARVPLPTAQARENLARLAENQPDNFSVLERLAEASEKLERFDETEKILRRMTEIDQGKSENLAAFYHRRARFDDEAEVWREILVSTAPEKRGEVFARLIELARTHDLKAYLNEDFYSQIIKENPNLYEIFERLIDKLYEEKNYAEALKFLRQAKRQFPQRSEFLLDKEISILLEMKQPREAEKVYRAAFDPFWTQAEAEKFYDFLNRQNRLRAYGAEIKNRFRKNPADFDAAVRFALYRDHDFYGGNDDIAPVFLRLERAKKSWTTAELVTVARLLLRKNEGAVASRFLYKLYLREDFKTDSPLRAKILYQLFEMFSDAENARLPLTKGDLRFYADAARTDTNPGIATGILSLIFSDTNPQKKLAEQERAATKFFNRAAAYRIFTEYKKEFPTAPELAQMYLDIVRLYAATGETEIAEKTLHEFAERFENSADYAAVAVKLADAFAAVKQTEKEREIYRKVLDYLGKSDKPKFGWNAGISANEGTSILDGKKKTNDDFYYEKPGDFKDYLTRERHEISYEAVLKKYVAALANEKKTAEILALYSDEIAKYPNEEALYEQRLAWLEQTNLAEEQFAVYKAALARFQTNNWRDKIARFFLRQKRETEFAEFSADLIGKLNDAEIEKYLTEFVDGKTSTTGFDKNLALRLYQAAHERFPQNTVFVKKLLAFYKSDERRDDWRRLAAEYFFVAKEIREEFLNDLASRNELRNYFAKAAGATAVYELFRAEAAVRLSDFETAAAAFGKLNEIYPHEAEISARLTNLARSLGQKNRAILTEAANVSKSNADFSPASAALRTASGEIRAELGDYESAREEWEKLIPTARGTKEIYLDAATVYWDYFQYEDARRTIENLREKFGDAALYAFEAGAILEAQHKDSEALGEYVRALGNDEQKDKSKRRLTKLFARETRETNEKKTNENLLQVIDSAFETEKMRRTDSSYLSLGYAEFLTKIKQNEKAEMILNRAARQSVDDEFLEAAKDFYQTIDNASGEQFILRRLAETAENPRRKIQFQLQLAESFEENNRRAQAKNVLENLVRAFPTNYGVVTETADFYRRLGFESEAIAVLQNALAKSKGVYQTLLARKLSKLLLQTDRLAEAERILARLHDENKTDAEIFGELTRIYVRANDAEKLRKTFAATVAELKKSDADRREIDAQIGDLRQTMIDAFTRLKDYRAAIEQHIEIINRAPDDENTENAINYAKRYGSADALLDYYRKLARESFKNYRWNVVLARIYEAAGDAENAVKNYEAAIINQPAMPELYLAVAEIETRRNNFDAALKNIDEVLLLTNDEKQFVRKKIEILQKAGREAESETEKAKLPPETEKKSAPDEFAEARKLEAAEKEQARKLYRAAFAKLLEEPLSARINAASISDYVKIVREEDALDKIAENLWNLREKFIRTADEKDGKDAGEARKRLAILDTAMTESIGALAADFGTDEERAALRADLQNRIAKISLANDRHQTLSLIQNLSRRARFGDLEETVLRKRIEENDLDSDREIHLRNLSDFYSERGAYQKTFDALEKYGSRDLALKAEAARLVGNREKELAALREIYWKPAENFPISGNENVARFLEILYAENRDELKSLAEKSSARQLQLINFLLGKGERETARAAIENSAFSKAWKLSRNAETSLALKEFDEGSECYFCDALQLDSIGEMIEQTPDKKRFLVGDDWFRLAQGYGEWLFEKKDREIPPAKFLTAMIENQPRSAERQFRLGEFYLRRKEFAKAIEHLQLAIEIENSETPDNTKSATLGAARFLGGETALAEETWSRLLADEKPESYLIYFQVLHKYGLSETARAAVAPFAAEFLQKSDAEDSPEFQRLIRAVASSFADEREKARFFQTILEKRPTDASLAEMLLTENLIAENEADFFYERLIDRIDFSPKDDYRFKSVFERVFTQDEAESVYEQENDSAENEDEDQLADWRKKYLESLLKRGENQRAQKILKNIEKDFSGRAARPEWLRLARIRLKIRGGEFDLAEIERFTGVAVADAAPEIKLPNAARFNEILRIFDEEKRGDPAAVRASFFARNLALGRFDVANFVGLASAFFQKGEAEKALRVLRLMIDAGSGEKRETALAEIAALAEIKTRAADAAKFSDATTNSILQTDAPDFAAEIALEFGETDAAIAFRQELAALDPANAANKIELGKILFENNRKAEAALILREIIGDKNSPRPARWQAREILGETESSEENFDAFAQFYRGVPAPDEIAGDFFVNSLIADKDAEIPARRELIKFYARRDKPFAALKLAETDESLKSDELLEILSGAAEKINDYAKAVEFEKAKTGGGNAERIFELEKRGAEKNIRATDFTVNAENTRKL